MKKLVLVALLLVSLTTPTAEKHPKGINFERLKTADTNQDGLLTPEEVGSTLWNRLSSYDADASGKLDAVELSALVEAKGGNKEQAARPGGANASFTIHEHRASNGRTLRYSLFVPPNRSEPLPLVLCLHGAGGNTDAARAGLKARFVVMKSSVPSHQS